MPNPVTAPYLEALEKAAQRAAKLNCARAPWYTSPKCDQIGYKHDRCAACAAQYALKQRGVR